MTAYQRRYDCGLRWKLLGLQVRRGHVPTRDELVELIAETLDCGADIPSGVRMRGTVAKILRGELRSRRRRPRTEFGQLMKQTAFAVDVLDAGDSVGGGWRVPDGFVGEHYDTIRRWRYPNKANDPQYAERVHLRKQYLALSADEREQHRTFLDHVYRDVPLL